MAGAATRRDRPATEADLLALPDEGRGWELIDGELMEKQSGFHHGRAHLQLPVSLAPYNRRAGGGGRPSRRRTTTRSSRCGPTGWPRSSRRRTPATISSKRGASTTATACPTTGSS